MVKPLIVHYFSASGLPTASHASFARESALYPLSAHGRRWLGRLSTSSCASPERSGSELRSYRLSGSPSDLKGERLVPAVLPRLQVGGQVLDLQLRKPREVR